MPAISVKQRRLAGIAASHPEEVYPENRGILGMDKEELHKYSSTKEKGLPVRVKSGNALRDAVMGSSKAVLRMAKARVKKKEKKQ